MDKAKAPVMELNGQELEKAIQDHARLLVDCSAPWCPDCRALDPVFTDLAIDNKGKITFARVNLDHNEDVKDRYQVLAVPTLLLFKNGKLIHRMVEPAPRKQSIQDEILLNLG